MLASVAGLLAFGVWVYTVKARPKPRNKRSDRRTRKAKSSEIILAQKGTVSDTIKVDLSRKNLTEVPASVLQVRRGIFLPATVAMGGAVADP